MRNVMFAIVLGLGALALGLLLAHMIISTQPGINHQLHNGYWPFTVELSVKDR